ncbi:MAG TPA: VOC family protein [Candidatus Binatia bacterium]|nr:VOC family protein [Candidatus Binatia bacterium]
MTTTAPVLNLLDLVARDVDATVAFYRRLGVAIPDSAIWRTESGAHHVDVDFPNGFGLHFDSPALAKAYDAGWPDRPPGGSSVVIGFRVPSREAVDATYADMTAAGYPGRQPPYDAFWGARYAVIEDPDANHVGLMSPIDGARRSAPPEL